MNRNDQKKATETRALTAARKAGVPIPLGEIPGEEPDFTFEDKTLGIEVSELLRSAVSNHGIMPVEEESYHQEVLQMAQAEYYSDPDAKPAKIVLYFANAKGRRRDKREMARSLAEFVRLNVHQAKPIENFGPFQLPEGFGHMSIAAETGNWWTGEGGSINLADVPVSLRAAINAKNTLIDDYRKNLAPGAQVWLLLYTTASVSRGLPIPHGIAASRFRFDFHRVFWFACLEDRFVEIQKTALGE